MICRIVGFELKKTERADEGGTNPFHKETCLITLLRVSSNGLGLARAHEVNGILVYSYLIPTKVLLKFCQPNAAWCKVTADIFS